MPIHPSTLEKFSKYIDSKFNNKQKAVIGTSAPQFLFQ